MPVLRVMADYESFPLWIRDGSGTANVDPAGLPISPTLAHQLLEWATEYDRTLDRDDPLASGFPDERTEEAFHVRGSELAGLLVAELPANYRVEYFDGRDSRVHPVR
jgi:hypothetical protein